jgi:hypothetical protein
MKFNLAFGRIPNRGGSAWNSHETTVPNGNCYKHTLKDFALSSYKSWFWKLRMWKDIEDQSSLRGGHTCKALMFPPRLWGLLLLLSHWTAYSCCMPGHANFHVQRTIWVFMLWIRLTDRKLDRTVLFKLLKLELLFVCSKLLGLHTVQG